MGVRFLSFLAFLLAAPAPLVAAGQQAPAQDRGTAAKPDPTITVTGEKDPKKRKICRSETSTGSIMRKMTCMTKQDWDDRAERDRVKAEALRDETRRMQNARTIVCVERKMVC